MRIFIILILLMGAPLQAQQVPQSSAEISLSFAPLVREAAPAVVNIFANRVVDAEQSPFTGDPMFEEMFRELVEPRPRVQNSLGSGVILSEDGLIVSNYHVVGMATEIRVVLQDRREFQAKILLADQESDVAILKIEADAPLPWLSMRNSDEVEVGELALAIGNPFGIGQTVSSGIVSGLARSGIATGNARGYFIQTDAAINPGNSGGALIDVNGNLIGVNTSILTRSGGSNGIGFAIPANLISRFIAQAKAGEVRFMRPWAGINGQAVTSDIAQGFGLSRPEGVVISALHPESPFAAAGLAAGDIVLSVDGLPVFTPAEMIFRMSIRAIGDFLEIEYLSEGEVRQTQVQLISPPETPARDQRQVRDGVLSGLTVSNINPAVQVELGLPTSITGVVVTQVSGALRRVIGVQARDILTAINGVPIKNTFDVEAIARQNTSAWQIDGVRGNRRFSRRFQ